MMAAQNGHLSVAKILIQSGDNPSRKDNQGKNTITHAEEFGHTELVTYLINLKKNRKILDVF